MNTFDKITFLENNLKKLPITDFDMHNVAETFISRGGWNDSKSFETAYQDCLCYMAVRLVNKH